MSSAAVQVTRRDNEHSPEDTSVSEAGVAVSGGGYPLMGSTGTKHSQITTGANQITTGANGQRQLAVYRRSTDPQLEIHGHRMLPKTKSTFSTALRNDSNDDVTFRDVTGDSPANRRGVVARKTPTRQKTNAASNNVKPTTNGLKQNGITQPPAHKAREMNGRKSHQTNGRDGHPHNSPVKRTSGRGTTLSKTSSLEQIMGRNSARQSRMSISQHRPDETLSVKKLPNYNTPEACGAANKRLTQILKRMKRDEYLAREDLIKNMEYVNKVIGAAHKRETSRLYHEEDELSEVTDSEVVPIEVKDWLTSTFTRSLTNVRGRGKERFHFRSVANAIRAGIVVDRLFRRLSSSVGLSVPPNVLLSMKNMDEWSFDIFQLNEVGEGHALKYLGFELLQKYQLVTKFKITALCLENFLMKMEQGYSKHGNPYHNLVHAADVAQTTHSIITRSGLAMWLSDLEIFAVLVAALIHDYEHTGTTNAFHINTSSDVALIYNDKAVLENHHISAAFRIMREENHNILQALRKDEYKDFRSLVIEIVLSTDMSFHFQQLKNMKSLLTLPDPIEKAKALSLVVHCADISHPAKQWGLHLKWTEHLVEEFFRQGDQETALGLPISPLCDRKNTLIAQGQIGFIDFIVDPSFQVMGDMLDQIIAPMNEAQKDEQDNQLSVNNDTHDTSSMTKTEDESSVNSSSSSLHSSSPKPADPPEQPFKVYRDWVDCFIDNKLHWRERAVIEAEADAAAKRKEAEAKREKEEMEAAALANNIQDTPQDADGDVPEPDVKITLAENSITNVEAQEEKPSAGPGLVANDGYETDVTESELALSSASSVASLHEDSNP